MISVDVGIPIPTGKRAYKKKGSKYPFARLEPGDSFQITTAAEDLQRIYTAVQQAAYAASKKLGHKYTTRKLETAVRVWRTA